MTATDRSPPDAPLAMPALGGRAVNGALLLGAAQFVKFGTQLASTIVLAHLLAPRDFGIFAMVMPIVAFVMLFQDFGISQAVIFARTITDRQLSSLFYVNLMLSLALAGLLALGAPLIARFYGTREVIGPILALAGTIVLSGLSTLQFGLLARNLRFGATALAEIMGALAGTSTAIIVAWHHPGPWAMVASVVANMLSGLACGWLATGWRPGRPGRPAEVRALLMFGGDIVRSSFSNFVTRSADNILIARYLGPAPLGYYDRAYKLLLFPLQQIVSPLSRVTVPILSRLVDDAPRYRAAYFRALDQIMLVGLPGMTVALVMADVLVPFMMGAKWAPAVPIFRWLGLVGLHLPLSQTMAWLLVSQSRTRTLARLALFEAVTSVVGFVAGLRFGVVGVAMIYAIADYAIRLPVAFWWVGREGPVSAGALLARVGPYALGCGLGTGAVLLARPFVALPPFFMLAAATILIYAVTAAFVALFPDRRIVFREAAQIGRRAFAFLPARAVAVR